MSQLILSYVAVWLKKNERWIWVRQFFSHLIYHFECGFNWGFTAAYGFNLFIVNQFNWIWLILWNVTSFILYYIVLHCIGTFCKRMHVKFMEKLNNNFYFNIILILGYKL